jgi:hypothetical protein
MVQHSAPRVLASVAVVIEGPRLGAVIGIRPFRRIFDRATDLIAYNEFAASLFVDPDRPQILIDVVAGAHLPAFDVASIRHNAIAP